MRLAWSLLTLALLARPAFAGEPQRQERPMGPARSADRLDGAGRAPSPLESGVVAFELPQGLTDLITGQGVAPGLRYKGIELGLTRRTAAIPVTLCLAADHVPTDNGWGCKRGIDVKPRDVNRGDTIEFLADMIQTGGAYRLYWDIPPSAPGDTRRRPDGYTEWSKPFLVRGTK